MLLSCRKLVPSFCTCKAQAAAAAKETPAAAQQRKHSTSYLLPLTPYL